MTGFLCIKKMNKEINFFFALKKKSDFFNYKIWSYLIGVGENCTPALTHGSAPKHEGSKK